MRRFESVAPKNTPTSLLAIRIAGVSPDFLYRNQRGAAPLASLHHRGWPVERFCQSCHARFAGISVVLHTRWIEPVRRLPLHQLPNRRRFVLAEFHLYVRNSRRHFLDRP